MNHENEKQDFQTILSALNERELTDWERERIWELLESHPEWIEEFGDHCFLAAELGGLTDEALLAHGIEPPLANVVAMPSAASGRSSATRQRIRRLCGLGAAALLFLVLFFVLRSRPGAGDPGPDVAVKANAPGETRNLPGERGVAEESRPATGSNRRVGLSLDDPNDEAVALSGPAALANSRKPRGGKPEGASNVPEKISFNHHVRPILSENCFFCHGPDEKTQEADLRLDTYEGATRDLGGYAAIVPGDVEQSEVWHRILSADPIDVMPPPESHRELSDADREILKRWIEEGARYDRHWAWIKPERPEVPGVKTREWIRNPIDSFVLARLEREEMIPNPPATPRALLRRLHLDLIGLPPSPEELASFEAAFRTDSESAVESAITKLLESPHFGERMALPWLDAARYADSNGFQQDGNRHQWPWRDWVVRAFNENMSFDRFTIEQLAGDLLQNPSQDQIIATAFNRNHMLNGEGGAIKEEQRINYVIDRVDTTATTWLGLTMACAQCHTHKYDPITHEEYFQFFAFFNNIPESGGVDKRSGSGCAFGSGSTVQVSRPLLSLPTDEQKAEQARLSKEIKEMEAKMDAFTEQLDEKRRAWEDTFELAELVDRTRFPGNVSSLLRNPEDKRDAGQKRTINEFYLLEKEHHGNDEWEELGRQIKTLRDDLRKVGESIVEIMVMEENAPEKSRETFVLERGDYQQPTEKVTSGTPAFLPPLPDDAPRNRLGLAQWLVDPDHPLTARVTVNRVWQQFFGIGIVKTSEDFGVQGELPVHPELLDWLSVEFVESGWDWKHLIRLIVSSATYQQSAVLDPGTAERDPENRLLARSTRNRLPAMLLRDQALAIGGLLEDEIGGHPVYPHQPDGLWKEFSFGKINYPHQEAKEQLYRRSLYTFWRRTSAPPNMFDSSSRQVCTVKPSTTNTPLQALTLLNDVTYVEAARALARRMTEEGGASTLERLSFAFEAATGRFPDDQEQQLLLNGYESSLNEFRSYEKEAIDYISDPEAKTPVELAALTRMAQVILNLDETLNRP